MIPFEPWMKKRFVTSDAIEWRLEQEAAAEQAAKELPINEKLTHAGLPSQALPGTYRSQL